MTECSLADLGRGYINPEMSLARLGLLPRGFPMNGQRIPNNFDNMVVPPFTLPPDRNTFHPQDIIDWLNSPRIEKL